MAPSNSETREALVERLGASQAAIHRSFLKAFTRALAQLHLTPKQFFVLHQLQIGGATSQTELAALLQVEGQTLVKFLDALQAERLIRRVKDDRDRRVNFVELGDNKEKLDTAMACFLGIQVEAFSDFTADELQLFLRLNHKMANGFHRLMKEGPADSEETAG